MTTYILKRLLLIIPTLFGIVALNFVLVQFVPGGPVEQALAEIAGDAVDATARVAGRGSEIRSPGAGDGGTPSMARGSASGKYRGAQGLPPELVSRIEKQFGMDKPAHERFLAMIGDYLTFDLGKSFFRDKTVVELIVEKLPVSISLGLWTTLLVYAVSIPLGVAKALRDGSRFDLWTSALVVVGYSVPGFLFAILLIVLFAGGGYLDWFPLRGLTSDNFAELSIGGKILDYFWHVALPVLSMVVGGFAGLTMLTKNSFMEEINKQYVVTARSKGLSERKVLYGHVFRNAMLLVVAGFPSAFIGILFTGTLLTEIIFSLDGLGLLGFEATIRRDYPLIFGALYIFTLMGLALQLVGDLMYHVVDPRIDFETRDL